jgi:Lrp/AsnC family transcriptional regulator, leucine-responsive regulatory protein
MMSTSVNPLDEVSIRLLEELQKDARVSYSALARRVGLSTPTVIERIRKLEDAGIIAGYGVRLDTTALGLGVIAIIEVKTNPTQYAKVLEFARTVEAVRECYFVTGDNSFVARILVASIDELQGLIERMGMFGATRTSVVLSQPIIKDFLDVRGMKRA